MVNHYIDGALVNKGVVVDLFRYREQITHMEYALRSHITQAEYFIIVMIYDVLPRSWKLVLKEGRETKYANGEVYFSHLVHITSERRRANARNVSFFDLSRW